MSDETPSPDLETLLLGARILEVVEWEDGGVEWTALTFDTGFVMQFSGSVTMLCPRPN